MMNSKGASDKSDRATAVEPVPVSPLRDGIPSADDIDDAVDAWHRGSGQGQELHQFLGWTWAEYVAWGCECGAPERALSTEAAQAIEARRAETGTGSVRESAVRQDAPQ
jgi:hypothetical protein